MSKKTLLILTVYKYKYIAHSQVYRRGQLLQSKALWKDMWQNEQTSCPRKKTRADNILPMKTNQSRQHLAHESKPEQTTPCPWKQTRADNTLPTKANQSRQHLSHLESFHVLVFDAVDLLQEVAEAIHKLFLFQRLDDVASLGALFNHSVHDVGVASMFCQQFSEHVMSICQC